MTEQRHQLRAAVYGIFRDGSKVLFLRRANTGFMDGKLGLPSGHVEKNESIDEALAREVKEEIGVGIDITDTELIFTGHRYEPSGQYDYVDYYFEIKKWQGEPKNCEPEKSSELTWANPEGDDVIDYLKQIFQDITAGKKYSSIYRNDN